VQNIADNSDLEIYYGNNTTKKATYEECLGLERFSVWGHNHIVERINDYYMDNNFGTALDNRLRTLDEPTGIESSLTRLSSKIPPPQ
jgi:hypothetical protein